MTSEDVLERMFACQHRLVVAMASIAAFEEWTPLEILAMRVFARNDTAISSDDLHRILGISLPYASRLAKKLRARGLIGEQRWHQYRALMMTEAGEAWLTSELPYLTGFAENVLDGLSTTEKRLLYELSSRVRRNVDGS